MADALDGGTVFNLFAALVSSVLLMFPWIATRHVPDGMTVDNQIGLCVFLFAAHVIAFAGTCTGAFLVIQRTWWPRAPAPCEKAGAQKMVLQ